MIKLINKDGMVTEVSERIYGMWTANKNGFKILGEGVQAQAVIPDKIIEFQAKKTESLGSMGHIDITLIPEVHIEAHKSDAAATMDIMKEYLDKKGIKYHPATGYDKLKAKYDAAKKH
jgi:hypothetical protein